MKLSNLQQVWRRISTELGVEIEIPFQVSLPNRTIHAQLLVKSFGAEHGMLIVTDYELVRDATNDLLSHGYGFSTLTEPENDKEYDRDIVIDMLKDWGWSGKGKPPKWY